VIRAIDLSVNLIMQTAKRLVQNLIYPVGSTATIRCGPLRGCRYVVTKQSGWSPILGRWEPEAQRLYCKLISSGETVWDLGANTGIHSLLFSQLTGHAGRVVAFEPLPINAEQLRETCELNRATNVSIVAKAVSDSLGVALFHTGRHDKQGSLVPIGNQDGNVVKVDCVTADVMLREQPPPDFVKIDIEGAESRALSGFSRVSEFNPTFAIDVHTPDEDIATTNWLSARGYRIFRLIDNAARKAGRAHGLLSPSVVREDGQPTTGSLGTVIAIHPSRSVILASAIALSQE
jgi:FkbM family methyltransferase